jgi:hypothetical protein
MAVTLSSEKAFRLALAAVHPDRPDGRGDSERYIEIATQRDTWREKCLRRLRCVICERAAVMKHRQTCSPICERELAARRARAVLKIVPKELPSAGPPRCQWCSTILIITRTRRTRPKRFCDHTCAARWTLAGLTPAQRQRGRGRSGAVNALRAKQAVADRFRHLSDLDARVRAAYRTGYNAGYQACVQHGKTRQIVDDSSNAVAVSQ